jgi:hypothetical protein
MAPRIAAPAVPRITHALRVLITPGIVNGNVLTLMVGLTSLCSVRAEFMRCLAKAANQAALVNLAKGHPAHEHSKQSES